MADQRSREVRAPHAATAHSFSLTAEAYKRFTQLRQSSESAGETLLRLVGTAVPELRERVATAPGEVEPLYGLFPAVSQGARKRRGIERRDLRVWMYQAHRDVLSQLAEELTGGNASELVTECILIAGAHPEVRAGR